MDTIKRLDWQRLDNGERVLFAGDSVARIKETGSGEYELTVYQDGEFSQHASLEDAQHAALVAINRD